MTRTMTKRFAVSILICFSVAFVAGCGGGGTGAPNDGGGGPPAPQTVTVKVTPKQVAITYTQTQQFTRTVLNSSNTGVIWTVDGVIGGDATVGTITSAGLYTPPASVGSHMIAATSMADPTKSASSTLYVTNYAGTFTYHNDNQRTGQNLGETVLTPTNVVPANFGKIMTYSVDGYIYAQPLYVANLAIPGQGSRNVVYVVTEHDSVYAFDADGRAPTTLWHVSFLGPNVTTASSGDVGTDDIVPEVGITSTPVIDPSTGTMYLVAKTKEPGPTFVQRLHALDITTGAEKLGGPVVISASVNGTGDGNDGAGHVTFNALRESNRAALLLDHGVVYIAFASHGDNDPYHGWILSYNATTLAQLSAFNVTPNESRGGIWQSGNGLAADAAGNLFTSTGNGTFNASLGGTGYGDSLLRLAAPLGVVSVTDYFTPFNQATLESTDLDLGTSGPILLPDQATGPAHLLVSSGKEGRIYLVNRDNMGGFIAAGDTQIVQRIDGAIAHAFCTPAYFNGAIYFHSVGDFLKAFSLTNGVLSTSPTSQGNSSLSFPGATPTISANGTANGLVWELVVNGFANGSPALLLASDASNVSQLRYSSATAAANRDVAGAAVKFTVPTVANGKVFVGTQNQ